MCVGGRVLAVTAFSKGPIENAVKHVYDVISHVTFEGAHYRKDIAHRAMKKNEEGQRKGAVTYKGV